MLVTVIVLQCILVAYHQLTTLVDLYPFNNVRSYTVKERLIECIVNGVIMSVSPIGLLLKVSWMSTASIIIYPLLLVGEYMNWWRHYFFKATDEWIETYNRLFRNTIIILPPIKDNPIPNLEHAILHTLTLLTTIVTYIYFFSFQ